MFRIKIITLMAILMAGITVAGQTATTEKREFALFFKVAKVDIDPDYSTNARELQALDSLLNAIAADTTCTLEKIELQGWASPTGKAAFNQKLSRRRAAVMEAYLTENYGINPDIIISRHEGIDWNNLVRLVREDNYRYADEVIKIIEDAPLPGTWDTRKSRLMDLRQGRVWNELVKKYYDSLRRTDAISVYYSREVLPEPEPVVEPEPEPVEEIIEIVEPEPEPEPAMEPAPVLPVRHPMYWSIHTNMLYDVAAIPNLGAEFYLGKQFSIAGNWHYAWWSKDSSHRWWRTYGGYLAGRYWFGSRAKEKPLTGHHAGLYGQILLYDFEWGGTGYLSGAPGRNITYHPSWAVGLEYGFALPISRRLNIDFTIGLGYLQGRYLKYKPLDGHYVWQSTHMRHWFGPTKLEVSLVWLLGPDNYNRKKGGDK